jgi:hypothetical protein
MHTHIHMQVPACHSSARSSQAPLKPPQTAADECASSIPDGIRCTSNKRSSPQRVAGASRQGQATRSHAGLRAAGRRYSSLFGQCCPCKSLDTILPRPKDRHGLRACVAVLTSVNSVRRLTALPVCQYRYSCHVSFILEGPEAGILMPRL